MPMTNDGRELGPLTVEHTEELNDYVAGSEQFYALIFRGGLAFYSAGQ